MDHPEVRELAETGLLPGLECPPGVPVLLGPIEPGSYCTGTSRTTQPGTGAMRPYGVPAPVAWLMAR